jgi:hypothetical protein
MPTTKPPGFVDRSEADFKRLKPLFCWLVEQGS